MIAVIVVCVLVLVFSILSINNGSRVACEYETTQLGYPASSCAPFDTSGYYYGLYGLIALFCIVLVFYVYLRKHERLNEPAKDEVSKTIAEPTDKTHTIQDLTTLESQYSIR